MKTMLKNGRVAFVKLSKPETVNGQGDPSYSCAIILEADSPEYAANIKAIEDAMKAVAVDKWGQKAPEVLKSLAAKGTLALHDGDTKAELSGYAGNMFVNARAKASSPPTLVDEYRQPVSRAADEDGTSPADRKFYSGCRVNAIITVWAQDNQFGKRINASLNGVQFAAHDVPFGGAAPASAEEFEMLEVPSDFDAESLV